MHLDSGMQLAMASLYFQVTFGNPMALPAAPSPRAAGLETFPATVADIDGAHLELFANSGKGLSSRDSSGLEKRSIKTKIAKIQCGINGGGLASFDEGREKFGKLANKVTSSAGASMLYTIRELISNNLCYDDFETNKLCDMAVAATVSVPGLLWTDQLEGFYDSTFDSIRQKCQDRGGMAWMVADNPAASDVCGMPTCTDDGKMGLLVSTLDAEFYVHDGGDVCPANPKAGEWCENTKFN